VKGFIVRKRYIIVSIESGICDGLYLDRAFAEKSAAALCETWPGLQWEVEETCEPFPSPGRVCLGHVQAASILKCHQQRVDGGKSENTHHYGAVS